HSRQGPAYLAIIRLVLDHQNAFAHAVSTARLGLHVQMKPRLSGLPFQYQQCHYCIRYARGEGWLRGFSPPAGSACRSTTTGSLKANVEPWPGCDSTQILPPCISTIRLDMASPRPVPPFLRVMALSACWNS